MAQLVEADRREPGGLQERVELAGEQMAAILQPSQGAGEDHVEPVPPGPEKLPLPLVSGVMTEEGVDGDLR